MAQLLRTVITTVRLVPHTNILMIIPCRVSYLFSHLAIRYSDLYEMRWRPAEPICRPGPERQSRFRAVALDEDHGNSESPDRRGCAHG